ncbi:Crp/Fnr family transcriptional regulator [Enterobacter sp. SGAir0187]|uniref:Crp/Fnr family transcriptional regulator n=1 Tax=Enterobacter sp. SGAir0187 TaxID=2836161 RepID=UPI000F6C0EFB|nr:Crp/Fnr family transcriptional regulator [Enterobacter sp. SGAir0187]AVH17524.2 Crp/Fnr family transcriptional regulator [Enterobacter sp. SGAir0187]
MSIVDSVVLQVYALPICSDRKTGCLYAIWRQKRRSPEVGIFIDGGEKIDALYALRSRAAKVFYARGQLIGIVLPGQVMDVEELQIGYCQQDIQAATEMEICVLKNNHFYEISQLMLGFTDYIVRIMSRSAQEKQKFIPVLTKNDALKKIQFYLQLLSRTYKSYGFEYHNFELPLNKNELDQVLAISMSTLSRVLERLTE